MKKSTRFAALSLFVTMFLALIIPHAVHAETEEMDKSISNATTELYRIEFEEGMTINSVACQYNLEKVSDQLRQVVFTIDAGADVFTFGYYTDSPNVNIKYILTGLLGSVNHTNAMMIEDSRLHGNNLIAFDLLELKSIDIQENHTSISGGNDGSAGLINVKKTVQMKSEGFSVTPSQPLATMQNTSSEITGSYHYEGSLLGSPHTWWHNGLNNQDIVCASSIKSPHAGDGNARYAAGYRWFPRYAEANFFSEDYEYLHSTTLWYQFDQIGLNNLLVDDNETLEMEIEFYNEGHEGDPANKGTAYQFSSTSAFFATNQPDGHYFDTPAEDEDKEILCVGVSDASLLDANHWYYWNISSQKGTDYGYANDGRFRINAQRGYRIIDNPIDGEMTWVVFSEEHEGTCRLGVPNDGIANWLPVVDAWTLDFNDEVYEFDALTDPVRPH